MLYRVTPKQARSSYLCVIEQQGVIHSIRDIEKGKHQRGKDTTKAGAVSSARPGGSGTFDPTG